MQSLSSLGHLESLLTPFCYGPETPLPINDRIPPGLTQKAYISQDCQFGYQYYQNQIRCFPVNSEIKPGTSDSAIIKRNSQLIVSTSKYTFKSESNEPVISITCVAELAVHNQRTTSGVKKLLLGLEVSKDEGALVIFDPLIGRPVKWITLPLPATSVSIISHFEKEVYNRPFFNPAMISMVGIAVVGLKGGQVLIVDLGLDDNELFRPSLPLKNNSCEKHSLIFVDPDDLQIATRRKTLLKKGQKERHSICIQFIGESRIELEEGDEEDEENELFIYSSPDNSVLGRIDKDAVFISAIEYIPQIGSLVLGYSFGAFQIWKIDEMELKYSSPVPECEENLILSFVYQQPVDDPKNFCYLWILFGSATAELKDAQAELYSLFYDKKFYDENIGFTYQGLEKCNRRLTIRLEDIYAPSSEDDPEESSDSSRFLVRPIRMWTDCENLTFFAWETNRTAIFYVGIFDLNQWYSSQTIDILQISEGTQLHPFWAAIKLETPGVNSNPWDIRIVPKTIEKWVNPYSQLDVHLYPASITFKGICLTSTGFYAFENFGIQEKLLRVIQENGFALMIEPGALRNVCHNFGIEPTISIPYQNIDKKINDRFAIFTSIMDIKRSHLIVRMAHKWLDGSFANEGLTIDLILDWIVNMAFGIRLVLNEHWDNMFNIRNTEVSPETIKLLNYSTSFLSSLKGTLEIIMRPNEVYETRHSKLDYVKLALEKLVQFSTILLTIYKAGLLPESDMIDVSSPLVAFYDEKRKQVRNCVEKSSYLEPEHKKCHSLMIDYLLEKFDEDFLRAEWNVEDGEEIYPPRHIGYILCMLLWDHEDQKSIARVVFYYLMDITRVYQETYHYQHELQGDISSILNLNWDEQNEIFHLWMIDHGNFNDALGYLTINGGVNSCATLPWDPALVLITAQGQKDHVKLLRRNSPLNLYKIYINMMCQSESNYSLLVEELVSSKYFQEFEFLLHFFKVIKRNGYLKQFVTFSSKNLDQMQKEVLEDFLEKEKTFDCEELLFHLFLKTKRITRAQEQLDRMRIKWSPINSKYIDKLSVFQKHVMSMKIIEENESKNPLDTFLSCGRGLGHLSRPEKVIKVNIIRSNSSEDDELRQLIELQEEKAKKRQRRSSCFSFSPLKHFEGNVYLDTKALATNTNNDNEEFSTASAESDSPYFNFNIQDLLKTPRINHRKSMLKANQQTPYSAYMTPPTHSILKNKDTPTKGTSPTKKIRTRFVEDRSSTSPLGISQDPISFQKNLFPKDDSNVMGENQDEMESSQDTSMSISISLEHQDQESPLASPDKKDIDQSQNEESSEELFQEIDQNNIENEEDTPNTISGTSPTEIMTEFVEGRRSNSPEVSQDPILSQFQANLLPNKDDSKLEKDQDQGGELKLNEDLDINIEHQDRSSSSPDKSVIHQFEEVSPADPDKKDIGQSQNEVSSEELFQDASQNNEKDMPNIIKSDLNIIEHQTSSPSSSSDKKDIDQDQIEESAEELFQESCQNIEKGEDTQSPSPSPTRKMLTSLVENRSSISPSRFDLGVSQDPISFQASLFFQDQTQDDSKMEKDQLDEMELTDDLSISFEHQGSPLPLPSPDSDQDKKDIDDQSSKKEESSEELVQDQESIQGQVIEEESEEEEEESEEEEVDEIPETPPKLRMRGKKYQPHFSLVLSPVNEVSREYSTTMLASPSNSQISTSSRTGRGSSSRSSRTSKQSVQSASIVEEEEEEEEQVEDEPSPKRKRSTSRSPSKTPTKVDQKVEDEDDQEEEEEFDVPKLKRPRMRTRSGSKTPTQLHKIVVKEESISPPSRNLRARSKTPTVTTVAVAAPGKIKEKSPSKSPTRSESPSHGGVQVIKDEEMKTPPKKRSRSKTPTISVSETFLKSSEKDVDDDINIKDKTTPLKNLRSTRSKTPISVSKSTINVKENEKDQDDGTKTKGDKTTPLKRSRSKTPTSVSKSTVNVKETEKDQDDDNEKTTPVKNLRSGSKTPTKLVSASASKPSVKETEKDNDDDDVDDKINLRSRSKTPSKSFIKEMDVDAEDDVEKTPPKSKKSKSKVSSQEKEADHRSKTPNKKSFIKEMDIDSENDDDEEKTPPKRIKKSKSRVSSQEKEADQSQNSSGSELSLSLNASSNCNLLPLLPTPAKSLRSTRTRSSSVSQDTSALETILEVPKVTTTTSTGSGVKGKRGRKPSGKLDSTSSVDDDTTTTSLLPRPVKRTRKASSSQDQDYSESDQLLARDLSMTSGGPKKRLRKGSKSQQDFDDNASNISLSSVRSNASKMSATGTRKRNTRAKSVESNVSTSSAPRYNLRNRSSQDQL